MKKLQLSFMIVLILTAVGCGGTSKSIKAPSGMIKITKGSFRMGYDGTNARPNEKPVRSVEIKKDFYCDVNEVTNQQYLEFCTAAKATPPAYWEGKLTDGKLADDFKDLPVVEITYDEALAFAKYHKKRLPTEEEWEFAARGIKSLVFPWGNGWEKGRANTFEEGHKGPMKVGGYPNGKGPFGTMDQCGNVWEWTSTPAQPGSSNHFIKGGSYSARGEKQPRSSMRGQAAKGSGKDILGFRCVWDIPE